MKRKHGLGIAAALTLGAVLAVSLTSNFQAKKAPDAPPATEEPLPPASLSAEDQGYVDCPDGSAAEGDGREIPATGSCSVDRLPFRQAPEIFSGRDSLAELETFCGAVFADLLVYRGSGRCQWVTALFPGSSREIQITWQNWTEKRGLRALRYIGTDLHFEQGLRPGLLLKDLVRINGKHLSLAGFGWESSGRHRSFIGGALQAFDAPDSPYTIQYALDWELFDQASEEDHARIVVGDQALESSEPALDRYKAQVDFIDYRFFAHDVSLRETFRSIRP